MSLHASHGMAVARCAVRMAQVLRGPRPPSVKWPHARGGSRAPSGRWRQPKKKRVPQFIPPPLRQASRVPEVVAADAVSEVLRLESAIQVLGETNPHAQCLVEGLRVAHAKTTQERIKSCKTFIERVRQREARAEGGFRWRESFADIDVRRGFCPCPSSCGRPGVAETDR